MGVLIKYTQTRVYNINNIKHDFAWSRYIQLRQARVKEVGEHLVCFLSLFSLFFYSKIKLTSSSSFLCMELLGFSPSSPTLGLLCKSQVCNVGVSFLSVFHHQRSSRYVVDAALMFSGIVCPLFFLILTWKG